MWVGPLLVRHGDAGAPANVFLVDNFLDTAIFLRQAEDHIGAAPIVADMKVGGVDFRQVLGSDVSRTDTVQGHDLRNNFECLSMNIRFAGQPFLPYLLLIKELCVIIPSPPGHHPSINKVPVTVDLVTGIKLHSCRVEIKPSNSIIPLLENKKCQQFHGKFG